MDKDGFLSRFRKTEAKATDTGRGGGGRIKMFFQLGITDEQATMTIVNDKGEPCKTLPDYRLYQGDIFNVLRVLDDISQHDQFEMNWGGDDQGYSLRDEPSLLFALLRSDHLVDNEMNPIRVSDEQAEIVLHLTSKADTGKGAAPIVTPQLMARTEGQPLRPFHLVNDVFALVGDTIHPVASLGTNYQNIRYFEEDFPSRMLEQYLSVFYSYVDHAALDYEGHTLVRSDQPVSTIPTLVIEKVDADMALYLRLTHTLAGVSADFVKDFDLTWQAQTAAEGQIVLRRIVNADEQEEEDSLRRTILRYAPDRSAAKEIWQSGGEFIIPQDTAGPFLLQALPELVHHYQLLGAERLREYRVKAVQPKMKLSLSSGIDFLEGSATIALDGEEFSLRKFLQQYQKQKYITLFVSFYS